MAPVIKRKVDVIQNRDEGIPSKRVKHTTSRCIEVGPAKKTSPRPSPEPSSEPLPATESKSPVEVDTDDHLSKSFQDLGIIDSLCDACTALGYKVHTLS